MFIANKILEKVVVTENYIDEGIDKFCYEIPTSLYDEFYSEVFRFAPLGIFQELKDYFLTFSPKIDLVLVLNKNGPSAYTDELIELGILKGYYFECDEIYMLDQYGDRCYITSGYVMEKLKVGMPKLPEKNSGSFYYIEKALDIIYDLQELQFSNFASIDQELADSFFRMFPKYSYIYEIDDLFYFDFRSCNIGINVEGEIVFFDALRPHDE